MTPPPLSALESLLGCEVRATEQFQLSEDLGGQAHEGTLGVHRMTGIAITPDGPRPYAVIVKRMQPGGHPRLQRQIRRESNVYAEPETVAFPGGFRAARSYGCVQEEDGALSLYLEDLSPHRTASWTDGDYELTAGALGRYHGASRESEFAAYAWMGPSAIRGFSNVPEILAVVAQARHERTVFREAAVQRFCTLWDRADAAFALLARLPRVLSHGDCHCENLFLCRDTDEVVAIDWAYTGPGGVGEDLGSLVTAEYCWRKMSIERFRDLEPRVFDAYLAGLREAGYTEDERFARLGFVALIAIDAGLRMLQAMSRSGRSADEYVERLEALVPYLDEASDLATPLFGVRVG